jgi:hypothetical protein
MSAAKELEKEISKKMTTSKNTILTSIMSIRKRVFRVTVACALTVFAMFALDTTTYGRLSANRLSANKLDPLSAATNSAAASKLAASRLAVGQAGQNLYTANPESTQDFLATSDGQEVFTFIVSCALPNGATLVATLPDGTPLTFFGELNLASEWITHPLKKAGRGWISACLFARINDSQVPLPISLRGQHQELATVAGETVGWPLEEGAFFGDYFVAPGEPVQWVACRGRSQAAFEIGGLIERDCTEPDPLNAGYTKCGLIYAGDCAAPTLPACDQLSPQGYYRNCRDQPGDEAHSDFFRQVITVFAIE